LSLRDSRLQLPYSYALWHLVLRRQVNDHNLSESRMSKTTMGKEGIIVSSGRLPSLSDFRRLAMCSTGCTQAGQHKGVLQERPKIERTRTASDKPNENGAAESGSA